jgi:hypothetical protein
LRPNRERYCSSMVRCRRQLCKSVWPRSSHRPSANGRTHWIVRPVAESTVERVVSIFTRTRSSRSLAYTRPTSLAPFVVPKKSEYSEGLNHDLHDY